MILLIYNLGSVVSILLMFICKEKKPEELNADRQKKQEEERGVCLSKMKAFHEKTQLDFVCCLFFLSKYVFIYQFSSRQHSVKIHRARYKKVDNIYHIGTSRYYDAFHVSSYKGYSGTLNKETKWICEDQIKFM